MSCKIDLPRPRNAKQPRFAALVDYIYTVMTNPQAAVGAAPRVPGQPVSSPRFPMLPNSRPGGISGLCEIVLDAGGREDLPKLAEKLRLEVDDLLPTVDAAEMLGFAEVREGDVMLTEAGRDFATADIDRSSEIFHDQILSRVPFFASVAETLKQRGKAGVGKEFFLDILDEHFTEAEAQRQFETIILWGRYAQLFEYDATEERLYPPEGVESAS